MVNRNYAYYVMHILHKKKQLQGWVAYNCLSFTMETSAKLMFIFEFQKFCVSFIIYFKMFSTIIA